MLRSERDIRRGQWISILICIVAGSLFGVWHTRTVARGRGDFITSATRTLTSPLINGANAVNRWSARQIGWLFHGRTMEQENRRLAGENAMIREENARLREANIDLARLRAQMGFIQRLPQNHLAADIVSIHPSPDYNTLLIGRGSNDGVSNLNVVMASDGLVGYVYDTSPLSSAVLMLTDSNSSVGAMVQRQESRAVGICKGNSTPLLSLQYLSRDADIKVGDLIISSGMGGDKGVYPKGLAIGTVASVTNDATNGTRRATIKPAVDFNKLEEVYVLK